ncbi:hypothetical protein [Enterococcus rotai]|uniref:hypothetical protein n=1 Tax=Enterococcus rotai TaxID=118060 RepID=UPI0035C76EC0
MNKEELNEAQIDKCIDQASKIITLKHELGLINNYIDSVNFASVLDKKESAFSVHRLLIGDGGLENIGRTIECVLDNLEDIANTLFNIDESEGE